MLTRPTNSRPYLAALAGLGLAGTLWCPVPALAADNEAQPRGQVDTVIVTDKKAVADEALRKEVQTALRLDPVCYDYHIKVRVDGGVVILEGFVLDIKDMQDAIRISWKIPGTRQVINRLDLVGQGPDG